jgi:tetratricopeptide (TPR) repeat protein
MDSPTLDQQYYKLKAQELITKSQALKTDGFSKKAAMTARCAGDFFVMAKEFSTAVVCYNRAGNFYLDEGLVKSAASAFNEAGKIAFASDDVELWDVGKGSYTNAIQLYRDLMDYCLASYMAGHFADDLYDKKMYQEAIDAYEVAIECAMADKRSILHGRQYFQKIELARREVQRGKCNDVD